MFELQDLEKAAIHFRALHAADPDNPTHTLNLAICLGQLVQTEESLATYDKLCGQDNPIIQAVLGRAQIYHGLGRPEDALASLEPFRERFWGEGAFLLAYMNVAHAAGDEESANSALKAVVRMQEAGEIAPEVFRAVQQDEAVAKSSLRCARKRKNVTSISTRRC